MEYSSHLVHSWPVSRDLIHCWSRKITVDRYMQIE